MPADGMTKALSRQKHAVFIKQLDLVDTGGELNETTAVEGSMEEEEEEQA